MEMKYCMHCGCRLDEKYLMGEGMVPYCPECREFRFPVYNTAVSMIVMNKELDKVLLIKQYGRDSYILVAGYINKGEDAEDAVKREIELLRPVRERADYIIDTGGTTLAQLHNEICRLLAEKEGSAMPINVIAFGYKYGIPLEADLVLDVRFLPNPFYVEELKPLSGLDGAVFDYVMGHPVTEEYLKKLTDFLNFQLPRFRDEGKPSLTVAVGCTGGRHRSITIARALTDILTKQGEDARLICRDLGKAADYV